MTTRSTHQPVGNAAYLLDPAWHAERDRLNSLTCLYDATTVDLIDRLGPVTGWRCAEVGAGTGSVAQALAQRVGPTGQVLAIDTDTRFLEPLTDDVLTVQRRDVTVDPLPAGGFDLVHARLLLEHLPDRDSILTMLASALAPGGALLVEDLDWVTCTVTDPPSPVHDRVALAGRDFLQRRGYDPFYGRRLPRAFTDAALVDVGTNAEAVQVRSDTEVGVPQWELLIEQLADGMLADGLLDRTDLHSFTALCHDGVTVFFAPLMVSTWGRRPGVDEWR